MSERIEVEHALATALASVPFIDHTAGPFAVAHVALNALAAHSNLVAKWLAEMGALEQHGTVVYWPEGTAFFPQCGVSPPSPAPDTTVVAVYRVAEGNQ